MKPLSAPRQPFVGLALMAEVGIIGAEIVPAEDLKRSILQQR